MSSRSTPAALGLYLVVGMTKASDRGLGPIATIFVGVVACTGGSVVRDLLLQMQVAIMRVGSFYAMAAVAGAVAFVGLDGVWSRRAAGFAGAAVTFGLRMGAVRYGWRAPRARRWRSSRSGPSAAGRGRACASSATVDATERRPLPQWVREIPRRVG